MSPAAADRQPPDMRIFKRFLQAAGALIHYRVAGHGPPVVLLHDSPRSSRLHEDTMRALAGRFRVFALDTPGYGSSAPLGLARPEIADFAAALGEALATLGLTGAPLYATHTSAKIALEYAATCLHPPALLLLDGLSMPARLADEAFVAAYMRPFVIDAAGAYLAAEWTRVRDMLRWFPWFDAQPERRIPAPAPSGAWLHAYTVDLLSAGPHYADAYAAAMRYDPRDALARVTSPVIVAARADDVLFGYLDDVPAAAGPSVAICRLAADRPAWLDWLGEALAGAAEPSEPLVIAQRASPDGPVYHDLAHGQMLVHHAGRGAARPLLILETPTLLHARAWQQAIAPKRRTIIPELPGYGESDPIEGGDLVAHANALATLVRQAAEDAVDILAIGYAAPLAMLLAERHPALVGKLILDGVPARVAAARLCPEFAQDRHAGSHLHRIWHMLRDGEAQWPWFAEDMTAARRLAPVLGGEALHTELLAILKQPRHFGDAAKAGLAAPAAVAAPGVPTMLFDLPGDPGYAGVTTLAGADIVPVSRPPSIAAAAGCACDFLDG